MAYADEATVTTLGVVKHHISLRKECKIVADIFHDEKLLSLQLHNALYDTLGSYKQNACVSKEVREIPLPSAVMESGPLPADGSMSVIWAPSESSRSGNDTLEPSTELTATLLVLLCPLPEAEEGSEEARPVVLRLAQVLRPEVRRLFDHLNDACLHGKPAAAFSCGYLQTELLRPMARTLRGFGEGNKKGGAVGDQNDSEGPLEDAVEAALDALTLTLADESEEAAGGEEGEEGGTRRPPTKADAGKVLELFSALVPLMEVARGASQTAHTELNRFLRKVLGNWAIL